MENEKLKFVKLFLEEKKNESRAVISLVFPFKLEPLQNAHRNSQLNILNEPGNTEKKQA